MTDSKKIEDSTEEEMNEHWDFLADFISSVIFNSNAINFTDNQFEEFRAEMALIEYGVKMAWPHAYKHGYKDGVKRK